MSDYIILTDSSCDLPRDIYTEWGVTTLSLTFRFDGEDREYSNDEIPEKDFYDKMRNGAVAKTAAINIDTFANKFEEYLSKGMDVLYFGLSSGLSTTFNSARLASEQLREAYPDNKVVVVDSRTASAGGGLLLYYAVQKKNEGATIEEVAEYITSLKDKLCHWFTVDDLVYLKRGGRVSAAAAFFGNALGIKPVLHVDDEGHLVPVEKVRGRKISLKTIADMYTKTAENPEGGVVYISHGDCLADAESLANMLRERHGVEVKIITYVGSVIGAHSGPGTIALFFIGKER